MLFDNLLEINRNKNGDYYFIYSIPNVTNHIRSGSKHRDEVLIVGVPQSKLAAYLNAATMSADVAIDMGDPV